MRARTRSSSTCDHADGHAVVMHDHDPRSHHRRDGPRSSKTLAEVRGLRINHGGRGDDTGADADRGAGFVVRPRRGRHGDQEHPGEPDFDPERELAVEAVHRGARRGRVRRRRDRVQLQPVVDRRQPGDRPGDRDGLLTEYTVDAAAALRFAADQGHTWVLPFVEKVSEAGPAFPGEVHAAGLLLGTWITDDPEVAVSLARRALTRLRRMIRAVSRCDRGGRPA